MLVEEGGPAVQREADLPRPLVLLQTILMDGCEETHVVSTERGEGERQSSDRQGVVSQRPKTRIQNQNSKLALTI